MAGGKLTLVAKATKPAKPPKKVAQYKAVLRASGPSRGAGFTNINRVSLLSSTKRVKLVFDSGFTLTPGVTDTNYSQAFRMDNIFDPDVPNVTKNKSVNFYSQLASLYSNYLVTRCDVLLTAINPSSHPSIVYLNGADSNVWTTDYSTSRIGSDIISRSGVKYRTLTPSGGSRDTAVIKYSFKPWQIIGATKKQWMSDLSFGYAMGSVTVGNPLAISPYIIVGTADLIDSAIANTTYFNIKITYHCILRNPVERTDQ